MESIALSSTCLRLDAILGAAFIYLPDRKDRFRGMHSPDSAGEKTSHNLFASEILISNQAA